MKLDRGVRKKTKLATGGLQFSHWSPQERDVIGLETDMQFKAEGNMNESGKKLKGVPKMKKAILKRICLLSVLCIAMMSFLLHFSMTCYGDEDSMEVDFSPKIINIESERLGEIRVFTNVSYSAFVADGDSIFIYFNGSVDSVQNIRATRDSWGNLILRFNLEDLLALEDDLLVDDFNIVDVVVVMKDGNEYSGSDDEVYLLDKQAP